MFARSQKGEVFPFLECLTESCDLPELLYFGAFGVASGLTILIGRGFVVAGVAARFAIHKAVLADANFEHRLAKAAVLIALALFFGHFALGATVFGAADSGGHKGNVARKNRLGNVPLVTSIADC